MLTVLFGPLCPSVRPPIHPTSLTSFPRVFTRFAFWSRQHPVSERLLPFSLLLLPKNLGALSLYYGTHLGLGLGLFLRPMGREGQLDFFHRQIAKAVQRKYLSNPESITKYHKKIAEYYLQKCDPKQDGSFVAFGSEKVNFVDPCPTGM